MGTGFPFISRASRAEVKLAQETLEWVRVPRRRLVADKAYDCDRFRGWLRSEGVIPCIPPRRNRKGQRKWADEYKRRVERTFAWLGNFRRLVVRWEKLVMM